MVSSYLVQSASLVLLFSLVLSFVVTLQAVKTAVLNGISYDVEKIITREVCIVGGGSTGTFAAIQLTDMGIPVVVIEKEYRLGGHTSTYTDPITKNTIDYGVVVFYNTTIVQKFFARMKVALGKSSFGVPGSVKYADFETGRVDDSYIPPSPSAAFSKYLAQLAKYPYVEKGFDLSDPVPADLLLPFGDLVKKYALEDMVPVLASFAQGLGNLLEQPTLYVFKNFGTYIIRSLQTGFVASVLKDNSLLYERATTELGKDVLLQSHILEVDRSGSDVKVLVQTPSGNVMICAKKLLFTAPPKLDNLHGWDLSKSETKLFQQFGNSAYYTGILRNTGIPSNISNIVNIGVDNLYKIPTLPAIYSIRQTATPGLSLVKFGSPDAIPVSEVKNEILRAVKNLQLDGKRSSAPELVVFDSHTPFELTVSPKAIANGFYKELYGLQGQRHTFYTGAAFHTHDSSLLWQFTEDLLLKLTAALAVKS